MPALLFVWLCVNSYITRLPCVKALEFGDTFHFFLTAVIIALLYLEFATVLKTVHSSKTAIFALQRVIRIFDFLVFFLLPQPDWRCRRTGVVWCEARGCSCIQHSGLQLSLDSWLTSQDTAWGLVLCQLMDQE